MTSDAPVIAALLDYCAAVDRRDAVEVAELFSAGARLELVSGRAEGHDEIVGAYRSAFADPTVTTTHLIDKPDVRFTEPDGDDRSVQTATARAGLTVWRRAPASNLQVGRGTYDVEFRSDGSRWMIARMTVTLDGPLAQVSSEP